MHSTLFLGPGVVFMSVICQEFNRGGVFGSSGLLREGMYQALRFIVHVAIFFGRVLNSFLLCWLF